MKYTKNVYESSKYLVKTGQATKNVQDDAKREYKEAKRAEKKAYKNLKQDYLADKGKELYRHGHTITNNALGARTTVSTLVGSSGAVLGSYFASRMFRNEGTMGGNIAGLSAGAALASVGVGNAFVNRYMNKRLRAYYTHSSSK